MGPDPYVILCVSRDAGPGEIKAAFRGKAKLLHPDAGGDDADFALLHRCYKTLMDPRLRAAYDSSGEMGNIGPDLTRSRMLNTLAWSFDAVLGALPPGVEAQDVNIVDAMRGMLHQRLRDLAARRSSVEKALLAFERLSGRFRTADGDAGYLNGMIDYRVAGLRRQIADLDRDKAAADEALEFLLDYRWLTDAEGRIRIGKPAQRLAFMGLSGSGL